MILNSSEASFFLSSFVSVWHFTILLFVSPYSKRISLSLSLSFFSLSLSFFSLSLSLNISFLSICISPLTLAVYVSLPLSPFVSQSFSLSLYIYIYTSVFHYYFSHSFSLPFYLLPSYSYISSSSSSWRATCTDFPDPLLPFVSIIYRFRQVFQATSCSR